jgi:cobalt-zinc-cadmium efflux system protein
MKFGSSEPAGPSGRARAHVGVPGHVVDRSADRRYLAVALALVVSFMVSEVVVGVLIHSLALLADAGHMLTDAGALGLSIWASRLAERPVTTQWTFGYKRAEILSAAVNGMTLVFVSSLIVAEAVRRLVHPLHVTGTAMIVVASVGVLVNVVALVTVSRANRENLNIAGVFRHLRTDVWAFLGTLIAGVFVVTTGFGRADPIASLVVVALMLRTAWTLLRDSGRVLFEVAPIGVDLEVVRQHLLSVAHVLDVHHLHSWVVTSDLPVLSAHVVVDDACFPGGHAPHVLDDLQLHVAGHFDVTHSTFQLEIAAHAAHEDM